ncbi:unnamed protein product [Notodromas monacha]|uniref:cyclin-dependent kinase n=1 Tax=Notodromas monacha TaxID=399045 RepID=A0A7R9GHQ2_9CRUS|nr:unnamed protein product [Notodromas monacha]CAG0921033.1 unnamed protein product [Notodromas monacha]
MGRSSSFVVLLRGGVVACILEATCNSSVIDLFYAGRFLSVLLTMSAEEGEVQTPIASEGRELSLSPPSLGDESLESADELPVVIQAKPSYGDDEDVVDDSLNIQPPPLAPAYKRSHKSRMITVIRDPEPPGELMIVKDRVSVMLKIDDQNQREMHVTSKGMGEERMEKSGPHARVVKGTVKREVVCRTECVVPAMNMVEVVIIEILKRKSIQGIVVVDMVNICEFLHIVGEESFPDEFSKKKRRTEVDRHHRSRRNEERYRDRGNEERMSDRQRQSSSSRHQNTQRLPSSQPTASPTSEDSSEIEAEGEAEDEHVEDEATKEIEGSNSGSSSSGTDEQVENEEKKDAENDSETSESESDVENTAPAWKRELMEQEKLDAERERAEAAAAAEESDQTSEEDEDEDSDEASQRSDVDHIKEEGDQNQGNAVAVEEKPPSPPTPPESRLPAYYPAISGCRLVEEFQCLNRIEEGTFGVVYRARDKRTNETVALKRLKMEKEKEGFPITSLREINTLLKAQHENIVTVREIVVGSNMDKIYLVMDYVEHDLKSLMETMKSKKQVFVFSEVKTLMLQLLRAIAHLHDNWILHRDIKTSNLLLNHRGILKVGDFGLAREYGSPLKAYTSVVVTLWYRAPELLLGAKEYSTPIDVWSVGCVFGELLLMEPLFPGKSEIDQLNKIFKDLGTPNERIWPGYKELPGAKKCIFTEYPFSQLRNRFVSYQLTLSALDLMNSFFIYDPKRRVTAENALKHRWFDEEPLPKDPALFPTWPAKSELGHRKGGNSPKPPSGGGEFKDLGQEDDDDKMVARLGASLPPPGIIPGIPGSLPVPIGGTGGGFMLKF